MRLKYFGLYNGYHSFFLLPSCIKNLTHAGFICKSIQIQHYLLFIKFIKNC